jgi:putative aminopeptidase FrvX
MVCLRNISVDTLHKGDIEDNNNNNNNNNKVIPAIIGATGTISKSFRQYLSNIPEKHEIKEMQKNSHIGHCTQTAGSADVKVQNIFHGRYNITCSKKL